MRGLKFSVVFIAATLFCLEACAFTACYEQTISSPGLPEPQTTVVKIKDNKVRMEVGSPGERTITIIDGRTMYSYLPSKKTAIKLTKKSSSGMGVLSDYVSYLESLGAKVIGSEKIGQYDCDIYEFIDPRVNMASKVWLWKVKEFPVKVEIKVPDGVMTTIMKNIKIGIDIDDSEFMLPAGVEIVEVQEPMEQ